MDNDTDNSILKLHDQTELLKEWQQFTSDQKEFLLKQIEKINVSTLMSQQQLLKNKSQQQNLSLEVFDNYSKAGNASDFQLGKRLIAEGKVGCLLIAGGQGTRLRFEGPKGLFPITPIKQKSLFQFFAEKVISAGKQAGRQLPLAIMTSPLNDQLIRDFFAQHNNFKLSSDQLFFFSQNMLPFLNDEGKMFLDKSNAIVEGPDGNGNSLKSFVENGIWNKWQQSGIQMVNYILIDNPMADPYDAELVGFHYRQHADVTVKCTMRKKASENVGVLTKCQGKTQVTEYSELNDQERAAQNPDGTLKHQCANLSLFCFSMDFIKKASEISLPLHAAFKTVIGTDQKAWKFETFIFDLLPHANKVMALLYPRDQCFAPLKNFEGDDSLATVQKALHHEAKAIIESLTGLPAPSQIFELSTDFYYPTPEIKTKWYKRSFPADVTYIDA
jgi:UDP-N-acetylglucosamine/UDP-N-acetylgalactosamine diphosphorylase